MGIKIITRVRETVAQVHLGLGRGIDCRYLEVVTLTGTIRALGVDF